MNWFRFWADNLVLFKGEYQPHTRALCYMILPCHEDWWWQYAQANKPANDNETS